MPTVENANIQVTVSPEIWADYTARAERSPQVNRPHHSNSHRGHKMPPREQRVATERRSLIISDAMRILRARDLLARGHHEGNVISADWRQGASIVGRIAADRTDRDIAAAIVDAVVFAPQRRLEAWAAYPGWEIVRIADLPPSDLKRAAY